MQRAELNAEGWWLQNGSGIKGYNRYVCGGGGEAAAEVLTFRLLEFLPNRFEKNPLLCVVLALEAGTREPAPGSVSSVWALPLLRGALRAYPGEASGAT